ncbi:MAG TPA: CHAT domain-containing protein [Gemmatimonadales bacterium]|nr:CHAT domain-containing protein [Gemmatimonadales bacterium]
MVHRTRAAPLLAAVLACAAFAAQAAGQARPTTSADAPAAVVREATLAVEHDSVIALRARWDARRARDSLDRAAVLGLATLARLTYDYSAAERLYRTLAADSAKPDRYAAYARLGRAWALEDQGWSTESGSEFVAAREVARAAGDRRAEAEAVVGMAFPLARVQGMPVGQALLDTAAALIAPDDVALRSELLRRRAIFFGVAGDSRALALAAECRELGQRAGLLRQVAQGHRADGKILQWQGKLGPALTAFERAGPLFLRAHDLTWAAVNNLDRADVLLGLGHVGDVREALDAAIRVGTAARSPYALGSAHVGFGAVAIELGDFATADEHLRKAIAQYEALGDTSSIMKARTWLVHVAVATGDFAAAVREEHEILAFYGRTGEPPEQYMSHRDLASIAMLERDWTTAARELDQARAMGRELHQPVWEWALADDQGRLALLEGDLPTAERTFTGLLRDLGADSDSRQQLRRYGARIRLADIYARRGELDRAEQEAMSAADRLDAWRGALGDQPMRMLAFQARQTAHFITPPLLDDQQESMVRVIGALASGGHLGPAFELAERRRARELLDRMLQADAAQVRSVGEGELSPANRRVVEVPSIEQIAGAIPDTQTAVVEFVGGVRDGPLTAFVVQRGRVRARVLPPLGQGAGEIARLTGLLTAGGPLGSLDRDLGARLLDPVLAELQPGVGRLVIIPDGPLHRLPFDVLRLADGRLAVERFAIAIAPSAAVLQELWRRGASEPAARRPTRILALGDPRFDAGRRPRNGAAQAFTEAFAAGGGLARLPGSAGEARLVGRYADSAEVRLGDSASEAYLKRAPLDRFRVIHLATHAVVDDRSVARTAIALTPGPDDDGFVAPAELAALPLHADLVVLSACRTAAGVLVAGEGIQGLTAPLLQAGAQSVVATRWRIGDRAALGIIRPFYDALAAGLPVADALQAAKLAALRRGAPAREWVTFTAVGDPLVRIPLHPPRPQWPPWAVGLGAVTLLLGALVYLAAGRGVTRSR